jgi:type IV pilus assembly protein PilA
VHSRHHKEEVVKRKGFTLIELMVVIAIIIILAAIAIPNYLQMTDRAKRSRIASDMATLATVLETYKTDWGKYPTAASPGQVVSLSTATIYSALAAPAGTGADVNISANTNAVGEKGGIEYIKAGTLLSMKNPFGEVSPNTGLTYGSADGSKWALWAVIGTSKVLWRLDSASNVSENTSTPVTGTNY